jgi:hypothetical protein
MAAAMISFTQTGRPWAGTMARVDSTTLLGVVGIAGTLLGAVAGAGGVLGAARVTSRGQAEVEEQRARRQAYAACSTALLARRDAAAALRGAFFEDGLSQPRAQARMTDLDDQRAIVARTVGAVAVEGPNEVASGAEHAAHAIEQLAGRLRDWVALVAGGEDRLSLAQSQGQYAHEDEHQAAEAVASFTAECRKVLHPAEVEGFPWRRRRRRRSEAVSEIYPRLR